MKSVYVTYGVSLCLLMPSAWFTLVASANTVESKLNRSCWNKHLSGNIPSRSMTMEAQSDSDEVNGHW